MSEGWTPDVLPAKSPWPSMRMARAARLLGVQPELLSGLINHPTSELRVRAVQIRTPKGNPVWAFNSEDIHVIRRKMKRM